MVDERIDIPILTPDCQNPQNPAIITAAEVINYQQLAENVRQVAARLSSMGIGKNERCAILSENSPAYIMLLMAFWSSGVVAVPLNTRWPGDRISSQLKQLDCRGVFVSRKFAALLSPDNFHRIIIEDFFSPVGRGKIARESTVNQITGDRAATILYTSGSGGSPRAVLHTLGNHYYSALGSNQNIPVHSGDRWLLSLPLYHVGGLGILFRALLGGGVVAVPTAEATLGEAVRNLAVSHVSLVSTQLYRLLRDKEMRSVIPRLRAVLLGGGPLPLKLIRRATRLGYPLYVSYGLTEMASQVTTTRPGDDLEQLQTAGKVLPYRQIKISDEGEILVKGGTLFKGYVTSAGIYAARNADGWFPTGDLGEWDSEGNLRVIGRKDRMFISGGENIQPEEIERVLGQYEGVMESVVVPVRNEEFGARPAAFLKMEAEKQLDPEKIRNFLNGKLPRFQIPDHFFPWPEEEVSSGIKADRKYLQRLAEKALNLSDDE
ncbi:MAG: o-succinylbenzoate--CoA ligase [Calditrichia bacterium]